MSLDWYNLRRLNDWGVNIVGHVYQAMAAIRLLMYFYVHLLSKK